MNKTLLKLFVAFCLVSFVLSRPFPEGDEEAAGGEGDAKEDKPEDAAGGENAGGENEGGDDKGDGKADGDNEKQDGGDQEGGDQEGGNPKGDDTGSDKEASGGGKGEEKDDRVNTYNKVTEQLKKETKVDHIESKYLKPALDNALQVGLRNPVVSAIGTIGQYSKISSCFQSMGSDVKKIVDQEEKSFKDCMSKKDASEYDCSEENYKKATEQFTQLGTKITSCVSSKGN